MIVGMFSVVVVVITVTVIIVVTAVSAFALIFLLDLVFFRIDHSDFLFGTGHGAVGIIQLDHDFLGQQVTIDDSAASFFALAAVAAPGHTGFQFHPHTKSRRRSSAQTSQSSTSLQSSL